MNQTQRIYLFLLRIGLGWLFLYAGLSKLLNPAWSAEGYIKGAKNFMGLYQFFLKPEVLPATNFLNKWGLTLIGLALILGIFIRFATAMGSILMLLYYLVILDFPHVGATAYLVDDHIIFILALWLLATFKAGRVWGLESWMRKK